MSTIPILSFLQAQTVIITITAKTISTKITGTIIAAEIIPAITALSSPVSSGPADVIIYQNET